MFEIIKACAYLCAIGLVLWFISSIISGFKESEIEREQKLLVEGKYQSKWLFSYNEKDAYKSLKKVCDRNGLHLMAKVRLFDLVEPRKGSSVVYVNKIRAKHVDFVVCDEKLVARCIVELDDSSHKAADRKERDKFVDAVLESVGYKVIHTEGITEEVIASVLEKIQCEELRR